MASIQSAEIFVKTGKDDYYGGQTVFGCVYLRVLAPCAASGVRLKVSGVESYSCSSSNDDTVRTNCNRKEYLLSSYVTIHLFKGGSVGLGQYAFPFQIPLPLDIPGTFEAVSSVGTQYKASVQYFIEASLCEDSAIKVQHYFLVHQRISSPGDGLKTEHTAHIPTPYFRLKRMSFTVHITTDEQVYQSDKHVKIDLNFDFKGIVKPKLKRIEVKLLRCFKITSKRRSVLSQDAIVSSNVLDGIEFPENGEWRTLWSSAIVGTVDHSLLSGFQDLYVPLKEVERMPTINGEFLQRNNDHIPDWMTECSIIHSDSLYGVPLRITESNEFSRLPSFMTL
ncbi:hypothetical protein CAPTEDRAFT_210195 [Capitella teleta]|uniref:Arrestin-like N-terminal domain-containing protein n=1 Tax=Capitella teleta TaxID=283909 RepID=R7TV97_CAPTE|nr:hypothetical protein CAPTEDRAFT_210195 [Capitella teleta]|eukprot:ELT97793.1 hypothetical protein CAPTEDRAFT_210195 [Capitella teleta]